MTAIIMSATPVVEQIKKDLLHRCKLLKAQGVTPSMCVVLVGENPASLSYVRNKKKMCEEIGANFQLIHLPDDISTDDFLQKIEALNNNPLIHGIIIQLPVSEKLKKLPLPELIDPEKDIDGFHSLNTKNLYTGSTDLSLLMPCTPKGIVNLLRHYKVTLKGKHIVVIGRSLIVGKPLSMLLSNFNATVTLAHSQTINLKNLTQEADIVISAVGKTHFLNKSFFNKTKNTVVVDVGMNTLNGKLTGDVDQADVAETVSAMTPVPGGVGPMTVISLIENLIISAEKKLKGSL